MSEEPANLPQIVEPSALALLARAEVDVQISTAHTFPRSVTRFKRDAMSMATLDQETAGSCFYAVPRGGKTIEGPSVRLAEIVGSAWGNLRYGARVIQIGERAITAQGVCHDLEKNVSATVEVQRRITQKNGQRYNDDMIGVACNAACSIALRNAIFKVVPGAYWHEVYLAARKVSVGDAKTIVNIRADIVAYFGKMGVPLERLLLAVEAPSLEDVGLGEVATLKGLATAIKDGDTTVDEAFPAPPKPEAAGNGKSRTDQVAEALKQKANGAKPPPAVAPQEPPPVDPLTRAVTTSGHTIAAAPPPSSPDAPPPDETEADNLAQSIAEGIAQAQSVRDLHDSGAAIESGKALLGPEREAKLRAAYRDRYAQVQTAKSKR